MQLRLARTGRPHKRGGELVGLKVQYDEYIKLAGASLAAGESPRGPAPIELRAPKDKGIPWILG